ncbi:DUF2336 domain-containing protein [Dongia soli]|uniref:DUF2336 domain-containing protein n=1 Tax=Dongia soli TaxID=600628 RepID=A0ABU5EBY3_9PROT|nr:DUF2336 domain-containing protein [Dongia soli]MDY0883515.1 DUF2336 domain-containing protein [Dongia soli]
MGGILTQADVQRLITSPSSDVRAATAIKVSQAFNTVGLSDKERDLAKQILRVMAKDAEAMVRGALASHLKASSELPRDVAIALARDIESVSLPVLEFSKVLSDADLIEIVRTASAEKQQAVAQRETVSSELANALIDHSKNAAVVAALMRNQGADLGEAEYKKALDKHGEDIGVTNAVLGRGQLPITIAERLVNMASERLRDFLVDQRDLSSEMAADLVIQARERATVSLLPSGMNSTDVVELVKQLRDNRRLTPSLILRTLCTGDIAFFEASLAVLSNTAIVNARLLIHDEGRLGLKTIYAHTSLPQNLYPAFRVAFDVAREADYDGGDEDRRRFAAKVIERILTQFEDLAAEDLDYLLSKLNQLAA